MSRALGSVLLMMFGGHGGSLEQDLRERPEQEMLAEEKPASSRGLAIPLNPRLARPFPGKPGGYAQQMGC